MRMFEVTIKADQRNADDPLEADVRLPFVPRRGDKLEVWNAQGGIRNPPTERNPSGMSGEPLWLDVLDVIYCTYDPAIEVWVTLESYDRDELERAFESIRKGERP